MLQLPRTLRVFKHKSVFIKMLLGFNLFVVAMIVAFGYVSYSKSASLLIAEVVEANNQYLEQARSSMDNALIALNTLSFQIELQDDIRRSLYMSEQTWDMNQLLFLNIIKYLKSVKLSHPMIVDIWLQYYRYPVVLNPEAKYNVEHFYGQIYASEPAIDWREKPAYHGFASLGPAQSTVYGVSSEVITFARTVPYSEMTPLGMLYINMKTEDIARTLQNSGDPYPAFMYAVDREGRQLFSGAVRSEQDETLESKIGTITDKVRSLSAKQGHLEETISGESYQIVFTSSNVNDWTYISVVPTAFITSEAKQLRQYTWLTAAVCLVGGLILSYFLTIRMYRPIHKIVSYIELFGHRHPEERRRAAEDELGFIDRIINYVYYEMHHFKDAFERNLPKLRQNMLYDLLEGRLPAEKMKETAEELRMPFRYDLFQVIVFESIDFTIDDDMSLLGVDMTALFDQLAIGIESTAIRSVRKRKDKLVSILNLSSSEPNPDAAVDYIRKVLDYFKHRHSRAFTVGVGKVYGRAEDIPFSYVDALSALQYKVVKGQGSVIFVDEVRQLPASSFHYTFDMEKKLINAVKTGNAESLSKALGAIWSANLETAAPTPELVHNLFQALASTAVRTIYELGAAPKEIYGESSDLHREVSELGSMEAKKACIERSLTSIVDWIRSKQQGQYDKLLRQIEQFVDAHYRQDLSQSMLSEHLGLSASYVSSIFKDVTGMTFSDYVNSRRIEQAKSLLRHSDDSIAEIAETTGFTNANTFIRVFKRFEGVTPGQFREMEPPSPQSRAPEHG